MESGKRLLIIGAGGYGQYVKEIAERCGFVKIGFLDDYNPIADGKFDELNRLQDSYDGCIVAIGAPEKREELSSGVWNLLTLIHPSAIISRSAQIGPGCVIEANSVIGSHVRIMNSTYICAGAVINHDAVVESYCQIDCNSVVAAQSTVPEKTKVSSCTVWEKST